jgi:hypothetical protein
VELSLLQDFPELGKIPCSEHRNAWAGSLNMGSKRRRTRRQETVSRLPKSTYRTVNKSSCWSEEHPTDRISARYHFLST